MSQFDPSVESAPSLFVQLVASLARSALNAGAGVLVASGAITADQQTQLVQIGVGVALWGLSYAWSVIKHKQAAETLKSAIAAPAGKAK